VEDTIHPTSQEASVSTTATDMIKIFCQAKEVQDEYEAEVAPDLTVAELIAGLETESWLPRLAAGERWTVKHNRTGTQLTPNSRLDESGVKDGDQLEFIRATHGAQG
jgi:glucose/arabinose dehydrogenase